MIHQDALEYVRAVIGSVYGFILRRGATKNRLRGNAKDLSNGGKLENPRHLSES
jgi:hypothetical protein